MLLTLLLSFTLAAQTTPPTTPPATRPAAPMPPIVTAEHWGSTPEAFPDEYRHEPKIVLIHHAGELWKAGSDPATKIKNLQSWGMREKGWHDVPYHFLIAPDGRIFEGRSLEYRPDTNTHFDTTGYVNIDVLGNFEEQRISLAQLKSVVALTAYLADKLDMPTDELVAHRDVAQTACPGKDFYRYISDGPLKQWVDATRAGETPDVELLPALEDGPTDMIPDSEPTTKPTTKPAE